MQESESEEKQSVKTYVPASQKQLWQEHAASLDMTLSEYVRCMVQRGKSAYAMDDLDTPSQPSNPRGNTSKEGLLDIIDSESATSFDIIVDSYTTHIENEVEAGLVALEQDNLIKQTPRGGWIKADGEE